MSKLTEHEEEHAIDWVKSQRMTPTKANDTLRLIESLKASNARYVEALEKLKNSEYHEEQCDEHGNSNFPCACDIAKIALTGAQDKGEGNG